MKMKNNSKDFTENNLNNTTAFVSKPSSFSRKDCDVKCHQGNQAHHAVSREQL